MNTTIWLTSFAAALGMWSLTSFGGRRSADDAGALERRRRDRLAASNLMYGLLGPAVRRLAGHGGWVPSGLASRVELNLGRAYPHAAWTSAEWLAAAAVGSLVATFGVAAAAASLQWSAGKIVLIALVGPPVFIVAALRLLGRRAKRRMREVRTRLPFVVDSMALAIECGASIHEGLALAASSGEPNAVQQELSWVAADVRRGQPMSDGLVALKMRLREPMVDEFVSTVCTGHKLGCSVSSLMLAMAQRMRTRRSHEIEAAAGRAQIQLYYPGFLLVLVCMAVVVAPFIAPMAKILQGYSK